MKKNIFQKVAAGFVGVAVLGMALTTSAMNSGEKKVEEPHQVNEVYVNTSSSGSYIKLDDPNEYDSSNCQSASSENCAWRRTSTPGTVPDNFDSSTAESLHQAGLIEPMSSNQGIYQF